MNFKPLFTYRGLSKVTVSCIALMFACSADDVANMVVIPDRAFGEYLVYRHTPGVYEIYEHGKYNYYLNPDEVKGVTQINISKTNSNIETLVRAGVSTAKEEIRDVSEIEYFTGLRHLVLSSNLITEIDLSGLPELESLEMNFNLVGKLDISNNKKLAVLRYRAGTCEDTAYKLATIDLSHNTALRHLFLPDHNLTSIDLNNSPDLNELIDLSGNPGPDGVRETADIVIPNTTYALLSSDSRLGVTNHGDVILYPNTTDQTDLPSLPTEALVINEVLYSPSPDELQGDANGDGVYHNLDDEFIEFYNNSDVPLDLSGFGIWDNSARDLIGTPRHEFPSGTILPARGALVVFGGGTPTGSFGGAIVQAASSGQLNINNQEELMSVTDSEGEVLVTFDVGPLENSPKQSYTRNPDITGGFVLHSTLSGGALFSPGTKIDASSF